MNDGLSRIDRCNRDRSTKTCKQLSSKTSKKARHHHKGLQICPSVLERTAEALKAAAAVQGNKKGLNVTWKIFDM